MIKFFLIINRHGQTRIAQYYGDAPPIEERQKLEHELIRKCVSRNEQSSFTFHHNGIKIIYKRYLAIYAIAGVEEDANELQISTLFDFYFQTLRDYYGDITESYIIYHEIHSYAVLNEIIIDGQIVETSKSKIIALMNSIFD